MKRKNLLTILTTTIFSCIYFPAIAQAETQFQTPSRNIHCLIADESIRCDVLEITGRIPPQPKDCELDWGHVFNLNQRGNGYRGCYGDTVADANSPVLQYGKILRYQGFTCTSRKTGLTCINRDKRGWELSRERQRFF
ncbi:hypothetical protein IQ244_06990 [Nostoc sp. LEGE 06077]|uniref:DUF6636 domain-containing protein n=1 Tax=Nostoc sp. LEGE 06077 TaxID=915325 RepID=UPI001882702E|nr:DUF6636 domain-containing protein [Nostoc sp. LEGE 06077]MBE9206259.1 hypothetical protein [Nostoc sp. LEGE 06077]